MHILILGGTRFMGKAVLNQLLANEHQISIVSRRMGTVHPSATYFIGERDEVVEKLPTTPFDLVLDFMAYGHKAVAHIANKYPDTPYIMISTAWASQYEEYLRAPTSPCARAFDTKDISYIQEKLKAESLIADIFSHTGHALALRLPVTLGADEHTGRLNFYRRRIEAGRVILVDGGHNLMQFIWKEDIASALVSFIENAENFPAPLLEAIPDEALSLADFVLSLAGQMQRQPILAPISQEVLQSEFPQYLKYEPFWAERPFPPAQANLFQITNHIPTRVDDWLGRSTKSQMMATRPDRLCEIEKPFWAHELEMIKTYA